MRAVETDEQWGTKKSSGWYGSTNNFCKKFMDKIT
jgi:hypothetical protein